ncbi:MAG: alpha/beta hydrolase [Chloroflexota bacterium]|nr:alpha/beta hydrolase [Chloroflexota bacterium]
MTEWSEGDLSANGITIHYHRSRGNDQPPILLLHGVTDNGLCWSRVARDLDGDIVMTDARGHGRSSDPGAEFSLALLAADTAAVIEALHLERPYVFGHSMGAITAAALAATYPSLVRAIVLEDPPLMDRPPVLTGNGPGIAQAWQWLFDLKKLSREERITRGFAMNLSWAEEEIVPWADSKGEVRGDILEPALAAIGDVAWREVIARISCPVLLVTGDPELGAIVTPTAAQEAAHLCKQCEVVHVSGAGHNIHRDRYDETMAAVRAFLSHN